MSSALRNARIEHWCEGPLHKVGARETSRPAEGILALARLSSGSRPVISTLLSNRRNVVHSEERHYLLPPDKPRQVRLGTAQESTVVKIVTFAVALSWCLRRSGQHHHDRWLYAICRNTRRLTYRLDDAG
jgi:hypothetical protein